jgi:uncharacterized protein
MFLAIDAQGFASLNLASYVDFRSRIVPHQDDRQSGPDAIRGQGPHLFGDFGSDFAPDLVAVKDGGGHGIPCFRGLEDSSAPVTVDFNMNSIAISNRAGGGEVAKNFAKNPLVTTMKRRNTLEYGCMLDKDLLDLLVCPACKTAMAYDSVGDTLTCSQCHRIYPVRDGIPILLIDHPDVKRQA